MQPHQDEASDVKNEKGKHLFWARFAQLFLNLGQAEVLPAKLVLGETFIICDQETRPRERCCLPNSAHLVCYNIMCVPRKLLTSLPSYGSQDFIVEIILGH